MSLPAHANDDENTDVAAEVGGDLHRALGRYMDHAVRKWRTALADVERKHRGYAPPGERDDLAGLREFTRSAVDAFERIGQDGAGLIDHLAPDELGWFDLSTEWARDGAAGQELWERVKRAARDELVCGKTGAEAVEGHHGRPFARAQFLAVRAALADGLRPGNGLEGVLVDGMAQAWVMHLRWLHRHAQTDSMESYRLERDERQRGEWLPPRVEDAEAVDRAALMADRFQRQFLRLMKAFRDQRRVFGALIVAGGQVNIGHQQVVVQEGQADGEH
ncbi:MAG: hypothetical protein M3Q10_14750 [Chloroflexota bacterium]|nr:hypothetical protein [Chloroflexota bacterium]